MHSFVISKNVKWCHLIWPTRYISNERDAVVDMTLNHTYKQRSRSFILVPINFLYATSYRLSIVTFALARTV